MARQKDQMMRFDNAELSLMKNTFADNEDLLFAIRKILIQCPTSLEEQHMVKTLVSESVYQLLRKMILPEIDGDAPLLQLADLKIGLNVEMSKYQPEQLGPIFEAKELEIDYLEQQMEILRDITSAKEPIILLKDLANTKGKDWEEAFMHITARNYILSYVDSCMQQLKFLSGKKEETVEETMKRLQKDSSR